MARVDVSLTPDRPVDAAAQFEVATAAAPYLPALVNLGHLAFLAGNMKSAEVYYTAASGLDPERPSVLLGLARVAHALEDYNRASRSYENLAKQAPELAEKFAYLSDRTSSTTRASGMNLTGTTVMWSEE